MITKLRKYGETCIKTDTHEAFASVRLIELSTNYRFGLQKIWGETCETNRNVDSLNTECP